MGKILLSPRILGDNFGKVVLKHIDYFAKINKLNKSIIAHNLEGTKGDEYVRIFDSYFKDDLILRMK